MPTYRAIFTITDPWGYSQSVGGEWTFEPEPKPIKTGLVDQNGTPLYRMPEHRPIGFDLLPARKDPARLR